MKSFQDLLEKRVRSTNVNALDFYTVEKAVKEVCKDVFGNAGKDNIKVRKWETGKLLLTAEKSLWRSELILNQKLLISKINKLLKANVVKRIIIL